MTPEETFRKLAHSRGGAIGLDLLNSLSQDFTEHVLNVIRDIYEIVDRADTSNGLSRETIERPNIGIVNNKSLGAFSSKEDGHNIIGIHLGTFVILSKLYSFMLARPDVFPEIGEVSIESESQLVVSGVPKNILDFPEEPLNPKCPKRQQYAEMLFRISTAFLVVHELAHLRRGHFHLMDQPDKLLDAFSPKQSTLTAQEFQALELDADLVATKFLVEWIVNVCEGAVSIEEHFSWIFHDVHSGLRLLSVALCSLTYLGFTDRNWVNHLSTDKHPPPPFRQISILSSFLMSAELRFGKTSDTFTQICLTVVRQFQTIDVAFAKISGKPKIYEAEDQIRAFVPMFSRFTSQLLSIRRALCSRLKFASLYPNPTYSEE